MPIPLRPDFDAARLRWAARASKDAGRARRLLALAAISEGATRTQAAAIGGVTLQVIRDWVVRFNAHGPDGLIDRKAPGPPSRLDDEQRAALAAMVESGPVPAVHGVVRWRLIDLCQWVWDEFQVSVSRQTLGRPRAARDAIPPQAVRAPAPPRPGRRRDRDVQKDFPARLDAVARAAGVAPGDVEVWFGDQARVGQKNKITRRWARRGTRPSAARDQRTASTYIFGAICPKQGKAAGLVLPRCNTEAMALHLATISAEVAPGRHAALLVDQAGWHTSAKLHVPGATSPSCPCPRSAPS